MYLFLCIMCIYLFNAFYVKRIELFKEIALYIELNLLLLLTFFLRPQLGLSPMGVDAAPPSGVDAASPLSLSAIDSRDTSVGRYLYSNVSCETKYNPWTTGEHFTTLHNITQHYTTLHITKQNLFFNCSIFHSFHTKIYLCSTDYDILAHV